MKREIEILARVEKDMRSVPVNDAKRIHKAILGLQAGLTGDVEKLTLAIRKAKADPANKKRKSYLETAQALDGS